MSEGKRYLGLELAGAKNQKTSLAVIEYYPRANKIFLRDIFDKIIPQDPHSSHSYQTSDEALVELISGLNPGIAKMGVNIPLDLPPCISCSKKHCPYPPNCIVSEVKWMRGLAEKFHKSGDRSSKVKEITPYTQRPAELWVRYKVLPTLPESLVFEIDEALGGNKAPLTARMHFLTRHLRAIQMIEIWPKLSVAILARQLAIPERVISTYRHLETGIDAREEILLQLITKNELFIYDGDMKKLCQSLAAFDAFICAFTALLADQNQCVKTPKGFPTAAGWIHYPINTQ
ncbi:MAG: hypothetical protein ABIQ95_16290 [Bdellovibrionia bacterium]